MLRHRDHLSDVVHRIQDTLGARFAEVLLLRELAKSVDVRGRTLTRLFVAATGTTPLRYQQQSSSPSGPVPGSGANENFKGLARQYFPLCTDLSVHSDVDVAAVMHELNTRPRKGLGYATPAAAIRAAARTPGAG